MEKTNKIISRKLIVENKLGMHVRPCTTLAKEAFKFESHITLTKEQTVVSAKSLMGLLGLEASYKSEITITADGKDAPEAVDAIEKLFENHFGFKDVEKNT